MIYEGSLFNRFYYFISMHQNKSMFYFIINMLLYSNHFKIN
jgi:hypothetical protein